MSRSPRIPVPEGAPMGATYQPAHSAALDRFMDAVVRLTAVDPVTTEVVRLRCARHHDCHT